MSGQLHQHGAFSIPDGFRGRLRYSRSASIPFEEGLLMHTKKLGSTGSTGVVTSPLDNHSGGFSSQTVRRISDLRQKWVARNQPMLDRARQLVNDGTDLAGGDRLELLPAEIYGPWDSVAEAEMRAQRRGLETTPGDGQPESGLDGRCGEPTSNDYNLYIYYNSLARNGLGIGDSGQPENTFKMCPAGLLPKHSSTGTSGLVGGAHPSKEAP
jgi:hypothetical protein